MIPRHTLHTPTERKALERTLRGHGEEAEPVPLYLKKNYSKRGSRWEDLETAVNSKQTVGLQKL